MCIKRASMGHAWTNLRVRVRRTVAQVRGLLLRAPWVVWAIHAALMAVGLILLGGLVFGPLALVLWGVSELTYLAVVHTMSLRAGATIGAAIHVGFMATTVMFLAVVGVVLPWFWLPMLALVVPTIYEVALLISSGPVAHPDVT